MAEMRNSPQGRGGKESRKRKCVGKKGVRGTTAMLAERGGGGGCVIPGLKTIKVGGSEGGALKPPPP